MGKPASAHFSDQLSTFQDAGHEGHEGNEGHESWRRDDTDRCVPVCGRDHGVEDERCERCRGGTDGCGCGSGEEVRLLQACRHAQHEAEEQAGHEGTQGCQPLHQGAMRFQGQACLEDGALPPDEEAQGDALKRVSTHVVVRSVGLVLAADPQWTRMVLSWLEPWRAVSPGFPMYM